MHYRYCRELGQLGPLRIFRISAGANNAYLAECRRRGQRIGDIKPLALHRQDGWETVFEGALLSAAPDLHTLSGGHGKATPT
jgi:hypothetical protein